jgi:CRISPR/Cas system-associated exonuclease Cas4 (RecB family)
MLLRLIKEEYFQWLLENSEKETATGSTFRVSSTGKCIKRQQFHYKGESLDPLDDKSLGRLRVGTLVHNDIQEKLVERLNEKGYKAKVELVLEDKELDLSGSADIVVFEKDKITLIDLKTVGYFSWSRKFGRKKNPVDKGQDFYFYQVGMYAYLLEKEYGLPVEAYIVYVKVDDVSLWKTVPVPDNYKEKSLRYWQEVKEIIESEMDLVPGEMYGVPYVSWECNYCPFKTKCDTPFKS